MNSQGSASLNQVVLGVSSVIKDQRSNVRIILSGVINQLLQRVMSAAGKKKKKKADEEAAEVTSYSLQQNSYLMASVTFVFMILNVRRRMRERCPSPRWIC